MAGTLRNGAGAGGYVDSFGELDPGELMARVHAGDQDAWVGLTDRYTGLLWSVARAMRLSEADAADAVQTTWLRLVESLDSLRDSARVGGWLTTTMRRECLAVLRRGARMRPSPLPEWEQLVDADDPPEELLLRTERDAALWRAFRRLKPLCQALLRVLMADPPPSYAEVAAALEVPVGSIGPNRQRCLNRLRTILLAEADAGRPPGDRRGSDRHG
jgi:RNA polymerase sigma factor (sigma-70 family)